MAAAQPVANLTIEGDVAALTLNSPPVNALSQAVREGILNGVKSAVENPAVKAGVLICDGKTFIAGADITEFGKPPRAPGPRCPRPSALEGPPRGCGRKGPRRLRCVRRARYPAL